MCYFTLFGDNFSGFLSLKGQVLTNFITPTLFYFALISYKHLVDVEKSQELKKYYQRDSISKMIITLCHEINNPLTISKLSIKKLRKTYSQRFINRCDEGLNRITKITHLIKDIQDLNEVDYGEGSVMYDLYEKIKEENRDQINDNE